MDSFSGKRRSGALYLLCLLAALLLVSCTNGDAQPSPPVPKADSLGTQHETEFGGIYLTMTIEDFNSLGFEYGDSVDISFSNGYSLEDIPYYNGYYVDAGQPLLVAYPGYDYIKAAVNYGEDLWLTADLDGQTTADVTLREKAKYLDIQQARDIHYSDDRSKYPSDIVFANFRCVTAGSIMEGRLYRSASPCDNQHSRAPYVDRLIKEAGVGFILNLSDTQEKIDRYITDTSFDSPYFLTLLEDGSVYPISLSMNYLSDEFCRKIADGFTEMARHDGPYLIHCTEGKDRTGFVCMLLEALTGAGYQEMADDYMLTYDNYYKITMSSEPEKYQTILSKNLDAMLLFLSGTPDTDIRNSDMSEFARNYLLAGGMEPEDIDTLITKLCE